MRRRACLVAGSWVVVVGALTPEHARADEDGRREAWSSLGVDATFMGAVEGPRGDLAYHVLTTTRAHFGLGPNASLSMGIGLPLVQLLVLGAVGTGRSGGSNSDLADVMTMAVGVTLPLELRVTPRRRSKDGVMFQLGASPVLDTAIVCALGGSCEGRKSLALLVGYAATAGMGWQWSNGSFVSVAYSGGHLWPGGHAGGVDALDAMYHGATIGFGVSFGR